MSVGVEPPVRFAAVLCNLQFPGDGEQTPAVKGSGRDRRDSWGGMSI